MNAFKRVELMMLESSKTSNLSNLNDAKEAVNQEPDLLGLNWPVC